MHDDGPLARSIVDARFQPGKAEGIPEAAEICFIGAEQADTGLMRPDFVGERDGNGAAGSLAVGDQLVVHHAHPLQVDHPEPRLRGR